MKIHALHPRLPRNAKGKKSRFFTEKQRKSRQNSFGAAKKFRTKNSAGRTCRCGMIPGYEKAPEKIRQAGQSFCMAVPFF